MKPNRRSLCLMSCLAIPLLSAVEARGQESPVDSPPALHAQLDRLNDNIERIATLLERSLQGQQLELLIQRVEMGASRLVVAEQNLRSARATRSALDNERSEFEARLAQIADEIERGSMEMTLEEIDQYTRELDLQLQLLKNRLREADREIIELENEVMRQRGNIRDWQDYIDAELTDQR